MAKFSIKEDLETRPMAQQIEILWISGPTWHDAKRISEILSMTEEEVRKAVAQYC